MKKTTKKCKYTLTQNLKKRPKYRIGDYVVFRVTTKERAFNFKYRFSYIRLYQAVIVSAVTIFSRKSDDKPRWTYSVKVNDNQIESICEIDILYKIK